jgi:hypothetical protein
LLPSIQLLVLQNGQFVMLVASALATAVTPSASAVVAVVVKNATPFTLPVSVLAPPIR